MFRALYRDQLIPRRTWIVGYARSKLHMSDLKASIEKHVRLRDDSERERFLKFIQRNSYISGSYDSREDFQRLRTHTEALEAGSARGNRLFYLALPPNVFAPVTKLIQETCMATT